ncbi:DUF1819 family protein [Microbacterium foliorum]|uniref:DUF1819 family protein n=1 Tax=Microbacterium foliorum TaxID=104336 RepID=UPI003734E95F
MNEVGDPQRYRLSFTVGTLNLSGAPLGARLYGELGNWMKVRETLRSQNLLQARSSNSSMRLSRELTQRLETLSEAETAIVEDAALTELAQLMWVAVCRRYSFIGEFAEEVLRERFLLMHTDLTTEHFDSFVREKALWHEELASLEPSTLKKLRANLFKMLREADLLTEEGVIVPAVIATRVHEQLTRRVPSDIRFFPTRETA